MRLERFETGDELLARAGGFLETAELDREFMAGVAATTDARLEPPCGFFLVSDAGGRTVAALLRTMPSALACTSVDAADAPVVAALVRDRLLSGPGGPRRLLVPDGFAAELVAAWTRAGGTSRDHMRLVGYRLAGLIEPPSGPGRCAAFGPGDLDVLLAWSDAFGLETALADERPPPERVQAWIAEQRIHGWWVGEAPVAATLLTRRTPRTQSLTFVWTPPEHRRRGHAARLVAELCRRSLGDGRTPVLFADAANPASNALYLRLGFDDTGHWRSLDLA